MGETPLVAAKSVAPGASTGVLIIGGGAAGMVAALSARKAGADVLVVERDAVPAGSTALSAGLIPAAGTHFQAALGIEDSPGLLAADITAKNGGLADPAIVACVARECGPIVEWLAAAHALPFSVVANFDYPGHSRRRMHGLPSRSGRELIDGLRAAAERAGVEIVANARAVSLLTHAGDVAGAMVRRGGAGEAVAADATILACSGYGANKAMVRAHVPALAEALYFGHPGNEGDAARWGEALGAQLSDLSGHQGHGSVAHPHGILITWATISEGAFQVNSRGGRFHDESRGYSEAAAKVLAQPGGLAWTIFDERIAAVCRQFEDYRNAESQGAVLTGHDAVEIARRARLPEAELIATLREVATAQSGVTRDAFGRDFSRARSLRPPYRAVRVTGALFHTQGGLDVDVSAKVKRRDGGVFQRLFAAGGAARGVSGPHAFGYLSGNGLLCAVALGWIAGREAAGIAASASRS